MKKSEIIEFLEERKCMVKSYHRDGCMLKVYLKYLSGSELKALDDKGFITFISGAGANILLEITGYIEWN